MKFYKLEDAPNVYFATRSIQWTWCSKAKNGKVKPLSESWIHCRETVASCFKRDLFSKAKPENRTDVMTARILAGISVRRNISDEEYEKVRKQFYAKMERAVNFINILEKKHGWQETKLYGIDCVKTDVDRPITIACLLTGSRKWLRSPHMISLWLLILRTAGHKYLWNPKSQEELSRKMFNYLEKVKGGDAQYMRTSYPYWDKIMSNHDKLFKGFPMKRNYSAKLAWEGNDSPTEGIFKLCKGTTLDKELLKRFKEVCN